MGDPHDHEANSMDFHEKWSTHGWHGRINGPCPKIWGLGKSKWWQFVTVVHPNARLFSRDLLEMAKYKDIANESCDYAMHEETENPSSGNVAMDNCVVVLKRYEPSN